jgi:hypothetical protein
MADRTGVLVRIPTDLLRRIDQRTIAAKKAKGLTWSRNDEIVALLEAATKGRTER